LHDLELIVSTDIAERAWIIDNLTEEK